MSSFNVGVMGLHGSGRATLINSLSASVPQNVYFIELDYPDNGKSETDKHRYDNHIKYIKNAYDLSVLLLVVNESFRDKEVLLIEIAQNYNIVTVVVITMLDLTLRNLNPRTHQFTNQEKLNHTFKERKNIENILDVYKVGIFHVSDICFPSQLNHESEPFQKDEQMLCQFIDSCVSSNPTTALQQHLLHQSRNNEKSNTNYDFIFSYDIIFIGVKDSGSAFARNGLKNIFDRISIQNIEYDEDTIARKLENVASKMVVVVVKEHIDQTLHSILNYLKRNKTDFIIVLNTNDSEHSKEMFNSSCTLDPQYIFALNLEQLENFNVDKDEKAEFLKIIQEKTEKKLKVYMTENETSELSTRC